jgi:hypothetical protein
VFTRSAYYGAPKTLVVVLENIKLVKETLIISNKSNEIEEKEDDGGDANTLYYGPAGSQLTEKELDELFRETGCRCCGDPVEYDKIVWTDDGDPACKLCSENKEWEDFFTLANGSGKNNYIPIQDGK